MEVKLEMMHDIQEIQRRFKDKLSADEINRLTAGAINRALKRGITDKSQGINAEVKRNFNIQAKYLKDMAKVSPKASGRNALYGGIKLRYDPIPVAAFKSSLEQTDQGVSVMIQKGKKTEIPHAFIATRGKTDKYKRGKRAGAIKITDDTHVFARGKYSKSGFVPSKDRGREGHSPLSRMHTVSPFAMGLSERVAKEVVDVIQKEALRGTEGALQGAVDKVCR